MTRTFSKTWSMAGVRLGYVIGPTWFVAELEGAPVGLSMLAVNGDTGWVMELGVRKAARGRGIASALLRRSFREIAARGCERAGLGVDAQNETGAVALYEKVGLKQVRVYDTLEKPILRKNQVAIAP